MTGYDFLRQYNIDIYCHTFETSQDLDDFKQKISALPKVWGFSIAADLENINDGRTIEPQQFIPIANPNLKFGQYAYNGCCLVMFAKIKSNGKPYSSGIVAYGSPGQGTDMQIFETYVECKEAWNIKLKQVIKLKYNSLKTIQEQINELESKKL